MSSYVSVGLSLLAASALVFGGCGGDIGSANGSDGTGASASTTSMNTGPGSGGAGTGGAATTTTTGPGGSAGSGGGMPADPCADRIMCEDFESTAVGEAPGAPWDAQAQKGSVAVDDARAVSGSHSLKVSIDPTNPGDTYRHAMLAITGAPLIPLANNSVYGRFMIYTDRIPDPSVHWTIAHGDGPLDTRHATYNYGGMGGLMANYYSDTDPLVSDCWQTKDQDFPTNKWTCVGFQFDGTANEMRFWLDGVEIPELHVVGLDKTDATCTESGVDGKWLAPAFSNIAIGWESYQHDMVGAHDAWIDDLILDDTPIPCP